MIEFAKKRPGPSRLTEQGLRVVNEMLCWKTELDLRGPTEVGSMSGSPAGSSIQWVNHPSSNYKSIYKGGAAEMTAKNFRVFLDPANYPIDIHCITGADRTGSLVFILNGVLGVDLDDLSRGWEISWYSPLNYKERFDPLVAGLDGFGKPDDSICKKIEAYLFAQGITPEEVAKFREIMLEPK